jgi:hypothetical protein
VAQGEGVTLHARKNGQVTENCAGTREPLFHDIIK